MRKYSCLRPISANALAVNTMYGSWVRPKIAGMESSANRTSVEPIASITTSIGVMIRLPFSAIHSLVPWYRSATPKRFSPLSAACSPGIPPRPSLRASWMSFQAVQIKKAPKR